MVIDNEVDFRFLLDSIKAYESISFISMCDSKVHPIQSKINLMYFYIPEIKLECILNFKHYEKTFFEINNIDLTDAILKSKRIYTDNKKLFLYFFDGSNKKVFDIELHEYLSDKLILNTIDFEETSSYKFYSKFNASNLNTIIPISNYIQYYSLLKGEYLLYIDINKEKFTEKSYMCYNFIALPSLCDTEMGGIGIDIDKFNEYFAHTRYKLNDSKLVYSDYNVYTSTGRPSNTYSGLNFAALNKSNNCRETFVSRFEEGVLVEFDYSAFHPALIANLIGYTYTEESIYHNLHLKIYGREIKTQEDYSEIKDVVFKTIYGRIGNDLLKISYYKGVMDLIDGLWLEFKRDGYVTSKIFRRRIYKSERIDSKYKLFNYYSQLYETEHNLSIMPSIIKYLKTRKMQSKLILYTYDSFLFDVPINEIDSIKSDIKRIMENNTNLKFHIKSGTNYNNLI